MAMTEPGITPTGTLLTVNPKAMRVEILTLDDGSPQYWLCFLTDTVEYKFGPYTTERWDIFLSVVVDPEAAHAAAMARSRIITPGMDGRSMH